MSDRLHDDLARMLAEAERSAPDFTEIALRSDPGPAARAAVARRRQRRAAVVATLVIAGAGVLALRLIPSPPPGVAPPVADAAVTIEQVRLVLAADHRHAERMNVLRASHRLVARAPSRDATDDMTWLRESRAERLVRRHDRALAGGDASDAATLRSRVLDLYPTTLAARRVQAPRDVNDPELNSVPESIRREQEL